MIAVCDRCPRRADVALGAARLCIVHYVAALGALARIHSTVRAGGPPARP